MYRLTVLYPAPADPEKFRDYYLSTHLPLTSTLPGLRASRYSFEVSGLGGDSPYFAIWEGEFDTAEDAMTAMTSPQGQAVAADVPNYATGGAQIIHYAPITPA